MVKNIKIEQSHIDFVCLKYALQEYLQPAEMQRIFLAQFQQEITRPQLRALKKDYSERIIEIRNSDSIAIKLSEKFGLLKLTNKASRIAELELLAELGRTGYFVDAQTARGQIVQMKKHDLGSAISALKQIAVEVGEDFEDDTTYNVSINLAAPDNDDEEIDEDEDI